MINTTLVNELKDALSGSTAITPVPSLFSLLEAAVLEFNLAADAFADVGRIPDNVTSLELFIEMLRKIKKRIDADVTSGVRYSRDASNQIVGRQPDYMLDGSLKLYKTSICAIHAVTNWINAGSNLSYRGTLGGARDAVCSHARNEMNYPIGLTSSGQKLWRATFAADNARSPNVVACVLKWLCAPEANETGSLPPGQGGSDVGKQVKGKDGK